MMIMSIISWCLWQAYVHVEDYGLDPCHCHYFPSPVLNWDAMLKITLYQDEVISELITGIDMYLVV